MKCLLEDIFGIRSLIFFLIVFLVFLHCHVHERAPGVSEDFALSLLWLVIPVSKPTILLLCSVFFFSKAEHGGRGGEVRGVFRHKVCVTKVRVTKGSPQGCAGWNQSWHCCFKRRNRKRKQNFFDQPFTSIVKRTRMESNVDSVSLSKSSARLTLLPKQVKDSF